MLQTIFNVLTDAAGQAFALTKVTIGLAIDGTINGLLAFIGVDPDGNAAAAKFNAEGALIVTSDGGALTVGAPITLAAGSQTKNVETEVGTVALEASKKYGQVLCQVMGTRDSLWRLAWVEDNGGTPVETTIGYGVTGPGEVMEKICPSIQEFTTAATGDQVLKLYHTPLDKESDVYANVGASKLD